MKLEKQVGLLKLIVAMNAVVTILLFVLIGIRDNSQRDKLSLFAQRITQKINSNRSMARIALYGTYCNNYRNRALEHFVRTGNWDGYVMFSAPCNLHDAAEVLDAIKYRGWKPEDKEFVRHSYDSFYTTLGHDGEKTKEALKELEDILDKEIKELLEKK